MNLAIAVAKTIAYGDYFNFPLSLEEIHFWLISPRLVPKSLIKKYTTVLKPKEIKLKKNLLANTKQKEIVALKLLKFIHLFPFIRLIAFTGSVAANNTKKNDDLDLLIITEPNTLWFTRPLLLFLLSLVFNRRHPGDNSSKKTKNAFCPNLWLDTLSLTVPKKRQNIYTAHEVLQVRPLFDRGDTYQNFIRSNRWTSHYLANAYHKLSHGKSPKKNSSTLFFSPFFFIAPFNYLLFILQYLYMFPKKTTESVSLHAAYFHKNDLSPILTNYLKTNSL